MFLAVPLILALLGQAASLPRTVQSPFSPKVSPSIVDHDEKLQKILKSHKEAPRRHDVRHDFPTPVMIAMEGYPVETHTVKTDDCYFLEMHRIPHGKDNPPAEGEIRPAVYLQHGLLCSSADWVMGIPSKSLGYILADAGYDVWLGNYRGNTYSRRHCEHDPSNNKFWEFSWDQMGEFDIPAMIDAVLKATKQEKLFYIGHSMGTTGFMVMANKRPEYQEKIILATLLSPVAFMDHMKSPIRFIAPFANQIEWILGVMGLGEFLPSNWLLDWLASLACSEGSIQGLCKSILFVLCGFDEAQLNTTLLETIMHHTPAGASTKTIIHYAQEVNSKTFQAFDHGKDNEGIYGQVDPPLYVPEAVTAPVATYWSLNDWLADPSDVLRLTSRLPNLVSDFLVPYDTWNHLDYLWAIDADKYLYPEVLRIMSDFKKKISKNSQ